MNGSINNDEAPVMKKSRSKLDASSPQQVSKSNASKPPVFHPAETDHTLKTIEITDDLGSIDVNAANM
jgi:hypothetical protein